ncbi:hypothetical protein ASPWEDRAFT_114128 [Aspergillus wentii DTO 134E9]|uniref:Methyltransferase domain-containing protein n=1 Tax=Aspergillus wentii DTO 134E9 TaxID=1073089 RepID=A0A1L9RG24_ASPWE|nr:uncharacterized protein ASPWEDRAFT_114128 [Aspergillus wentii DTO 134E9]KAI9925631.1 hypothetical protein MW887_006014 [Aspergillus wentii]OJJ33871.1 hypothetical protein ASPWEDRAFT_114128 [Aspergillus wentii DTO 134E9]
MALSHGASHTKTKGAPDYDDPEFWDVKFATGQDVGEWLNPGEVLLEAVLSDLERRHSTSLAAGARPRVLHLGPGVSKLGTKLCEMFVERGWVGNGIVNVDFSAEAVRLGQEYESKKEVNDAMMHWQQADLRSWTDMSSLSPSAPFDVILDKSTSDAISTSPDQTYSPSSDVSTTCPIVNEIVTSQNREIAFSPVELLGLHLVPLTQKGSTWIVLSYSTMRFDNIPHVSVYWDVVSRTPMEAPAGNVSSAAHAPKVFHWVYILQRK